jgi:hypothetical protein
MYCTMYLGILFRPNIPFLLPENEELKWIDAHIRDKIKTPRTLLTMTLSKI